MKQPTLMNLSGLFNCVYMNTKDLAGIAIVIRMKLENTVGKKVVDRESRLITRKIKETLHSFKNPNHIKKIFFMLLEIWFLIYGSS